MADFEWWRLIDRKAAILERFPSPAKVTRERPGTERDRANRELYAAENQASWLTRRATTAQERDADEFIRRMRQAEQDRFLARLHRGAGS